MKSKIELGHTGAKLYSRIMEFNSEINVFVGANSNSTLVEHGERFANIVIWISDAAKPAYEAVVYVRTVSPDGNISCKLVVAKSRVSPVNQVKIHRLELSADDLLSQLMESVEMLWH